MKAGYYDSRYKTDTEKEIHEKYESEDADVVAIILFLCLAMACGFTCLYFYKYGKTQEEPAPEFSDPANIANGQ